MRFIIVALYRGPFLADLHLADSSQFESWTVNQRASLQLQALENLDTLTEFHLEQREYSRAQELAWRQLDIDQLREQAVRQLMTALAKSGQRSAAMAQYEIYRRRFVAGLWPTRLEKPGRQAANLWFELSLTQSPLGGGPGAC